jgi:hypothetical protein
MNASAWSYTYAKTALMAGYGAGPSSQGGGVMRAWR